MAIKQTTDGIKIAKKSKKLSIPHTSVYRSL